ncbi:MAG: ribonuclease III [Eubacteriaceae bacterium]|jgi:ribonuclease-3
MNKTEEKIKYCFKNRGLLTTALTHSSWSQHGENNERLEFLGDAVLELVISEYLYRNFSLAEGKMTKLRANIVCTESLSLAAQELGLGEQLRLGKGERNTGGSNRRSNLANVFEAVMGAVFLDSDYKTVSEVILRVLAENIELARAGKLVKDYKTELQEQIQKEQGHTIEYRDLDATGPDHDRVFNTELLIDNCEAGTGSGKTKKEAEQEAAKSWLRQEKTETQNR